MNPNPEAAGVRHAEPPSCANRQGTSAPACYNLLQVG
jgi:hypothetical protein